MKKRFLSALLCVAMVASCLMGCGAKEEAAEVSATNEEVAEEVTAEEAEDVVLTVLTRSDVSPDDALVMEEANKYIKEKLGFTVEFLNLGPSSYNEKTQMMFAAGDAFDVCYTASDVDFVNNVANGVYLPLDDLIQEYGQGILEVAPSHVFDAATVDGKLYAVPTMKDLVFPRIFRVKAYFAEKYNLDISEVDSLEDMTPILQTLKDNEPEYATLLMKGNYNMVDLLPFENIAGTFVLAFDNATGEIVNKFETEEMKEFLPLMRDWNQRGFFPADVETLTTLGDYTGPGTWAAEVTTYSPYQDIQTAEATSGTDKVFVYSKELMTEPYMTTTGVMGAAWAISAQSEHPEKAMQLINLIDTDVYLRNLLSYGIEGKHYIKVGENQYKLPEGMTSAADTGYAPYSWFLGNTYELYVQENQPADFWDKVEELNNSATPSPALGFNVNLEPIAAEVAAIGNVYAEFGPALECGSIDYEENLPKFIDKLYAAGLQTVIDEVNAQYDDWLATQ